MRRLVAAMLALGTPWGLWVQLPEPLTGIAALIADLYDPILRDLRDSMRHD